MEHRVNILTISGSLRVISSNAATLDAAALLAPAGMVLTRYKGLAELPHFNPDLDGAAPPPSVLELRRLVGEADGLLLSSPEYAHGIAGAFKNGLDWLVRSLEFPGKPVALINVAPRAHHGDEQVLEVLATMSARLVEAAMLTLPVQGTKLDAAGIVAEESLATPLRKMLDIFGRAIQEG
jgi:NAD(P)H-dependent FMN reductase